MNKIGISSDCMCDLPEDYLEENSIDILHFYIHTATGRFKDGDEITSENILEYLESGEAILSPNVPPPEEYVEFFEEKLQKYDVLLHISTSDKIGLSYPNALAALELMGENAKRVILINSGGISTGLGHMILRAAAMRDEGRTAEEITAACEEMRGRISSSFIVPGAYYLHRMGYASKAVKNLCALLHVHPVLCVKNGKLSVKAFQVGNYEKAVMRYVRREFKNNDRIDKSQLFITHAGCPTKIISQIKAETEILCKFDKMTVTKASAVISSCCGPETVGVLFVNKAV